jgi:hypothetical protein
MGKEALGSLKNLPTIMTCTLLIRNQDIFLDGKVVGLV